MHAEIEERRAVLFQCSVNNIPLNADSVDVAFSCNSFYFWPNIPSSSVELLRVIKPGGRLITVQNIDSVLKRKRRGGFNLANVDFVAYMRTLESVGFSDVNIEYFTDSVTKTPYQCISAGVS